MIAKNDPMQQGQILLVSLLVLIVAMIVGLSVVTRTITNLRVTSVEDNSQRAFSAAEAGIERLLTANVNTSLAGNLGNNSTFNSTKTLVTGDQFLVNNGSFVLKDDVVDIWLSNYPDYSSPWSGNLVIYWGSSSDACVGVPESNNSMAALEVVLLSGTKSNPKIDHFAYDPCGARRGVNAFDTVGAGGSVSGRNFAYSVTLAVNSGLLARIVPLYAGSYMAVAGAGIPPQGTVVTSTGSAGGTQRKIVSFRGYPRAPIELFPFLIFSPK